MEYNLIKQPAALMRAAGMTRAAAYEGGSPTIQKANGNTFSIITLAELKKELRK